ncbi:MAG: Ig-like domain-containing protein, partial [Gemmatimonadota bacterium]
DSQAPLAPAAQVVIASAPGSLVVGDTVRLTALVLGAGGDTLEDRIVVWASSDPGVASVSASGLVSAVSGGDVQISAASEAVAGTVPITAVDPLVATQIFAGGVSTNSCAILPGGSVRCWGQNFSGALGLGVSGGVFTVPTPQQAGPIQQVAVGESHGCSLSQGGAVACWGSNPFGGVGDSTTNIRVLPVNVAGGGGYTEIGAGVWLSCGIRNGDWVCWGNFSPGSLYPIVVGSGPYHGLRVGEGHGCALRTDGSAWCFGVGFAGQLGDDGSSYQSTPVAVAGNHHFATLAAGGRHTCGIDSLGGSWCWGANLGGQLGDGTTATQSHPVAVTGAPAFASIAAGGQHSCGLTPAGVAWCWGDNSSGQLGDGTTTNRPQPVTIGGTLRFSQLAAGAVHTCGVAQDGRVYCWGGNYLGSLGDGTTTDRQTPTLVHAS